jgi:hypothetical protein
MSGPKDYDRGHRDAEYDHGKHTPYDSFLDRLFWTDEQVKDREDYRDGYEDGLKDK